MERLSELQSNPFLQHFRHVLQVLDAPSWHSIETKSAADEWFALRLKAHAMMDAFPRYVVEKIHPERVVRSLEKYESRFNCDLPAGLIHTLRSAALDVREWNEYLSDILNLISRHPVFKKCVSHLPVMTDWFRFPDADWKYLPFLNWDRLQRLDEAFKKWLPGFSPGSFYRAQWLLLPGKTKYTCLRWIRYKMHPEKYPVFERYLMKESLTGNRHLHQKAENLLINAMQMGER